MLNWTVDRGTGAETAVLSVVSLTVIYDHDEDAYIGYVVTVNGEQQLDGKFSTLDKAKAAVITDSCFASFSLRLYF